MLNAVITTTTTNIIIIMTIFVNIIALLLLLFKYFFQLFFFYIFLLPWLLLFFFFFFFFFCCYYFFWRTVVFLIYCPFFSLPKFIHVAVKIINYWYPGIINLSSDFWSRCMDSLKRITIIIIIVDNIGTAATIINFGATELGFTTFV